MTVEAVLHLPALGTSTREARRFVSSTLRDMELDHLEESATLAISELVTNAVLHARTEIDVTIRSDDERVCIAVGDLDADLPVARSYGAYATTGRGLGLITAVVDDLGVRPREVGKTVWFALSRDRVDHGGAAAPAGSAALGETDDAQLPDLALWGLDDGHGPDVEVLEHEATTRASDVAVLEGLPVPLWRAAQQHHEAALRELVLYRGRRIPEAVEAWTWYAAADRAHTVLASAVDRAVAAALAADAPLAHPPPGHPSPAPPDLLAVTVQVPGDPELRAGFAALAEALDDADRLAAEGRLLIHPALPEVVALRDWCCHQVIARAGGAPPAPWQDQQPAAEGSGQPAGLARVPVDWDDAPVRRALGAVVAVDDRNRIVGLSAAAEVLLGWPAGELVGRRLVTLIPPRLREAHVAGFTRHQVTGESRVLGVPVILPVLHADGRELDCRLLIERVPTPGGRSVYLAAMSPA